MFNAEEESYLIVPEIEPVRTFLSNALNLRLNGDKAQYDLIVDQMRVRDDPETLWKILVALCSFTYQLTKHAEDFRALLNCIFHYDWKCDVKVNVAVIHLINHLVSTNSTFLGRAFQLYVKSLLPSLVTANAAESEEDVLSDRRNLIHRAIKAILTQVPTGRSVLFPILSEFFPHKRFSRNVQTEYTAQLLEMCKYEPMLQARILELIVSKCLEMDVEIVIEESGEVRIDPEALDDDDLDFEDAFDDGTFSHHPSRGHSRSNSQINAAGKRKQLTEATPTRIPAEVSEMADKLDSVLVLVVQFCEQQISLTAGAGDRLFQQLLSIFETTIMTIHKSKFVQFVIFFAASLHHSFAQSVAEKLLSITLDERTSSSQRQSAVMYLSSYLSRATFLQAEYVSDVITRLMAWAAQYAVRTGGTSPSPYLTPHPSPLTPVPSSGAFKTSVSTSSMQALSGQTTREASLESSAAFRAAQRHSSSEVNLSSLHLTQSTSSSKLVQIHGDARPASEIDFDEFGRAFVREVTVSRHELFYSVVQSACYTMCFYGTEVATKQRDDEKTRMNWEVVVSSRYDPLRYCLKSVRIEFIRLASVVGLFSPTCWDVVSSDLLYTDILQQQQQQQAVTKPGKASDNATMTTFTTNEATTATHHMSSNHQPQYQHTNAYHQVQSQGLIIANGNQKEVYSANTLDSFFPFDPCLLCKLHQTVQKSYRAWDGVPGIDDTDINDYYYEDEDQEDDSFADSESHRGHKSSQKIPMRRSGHSGSGSKNNNMSGSAASNASSMMDHFTTSSLSSVVSSIACTDNAMSIASSVHYMAQSPYAGSYLGAHFPAKMHEQEESEDEDEEDRNMHESHMNIPSTVGAGASVGAHRGIAGIAAAGAGEQFDSNFRRPRFYSIGSTGSW